LPCPATLLLGPTPSARTNLASEAAAHRKKQQPPANSRALDYPHCSQVKHPLNTYSE
jgi:hypothetical protein